MDVTIKEVFMALDVLQGLKKHIRPTLLISYCFCLMDLFKLC